MILVNLLHTNQRCDSGQCGKPVVSGKNKCLRHFRSLKVQIKKTDQRNRERVARGLCFRCSEPSVSGIFCERHAKKSRASCVRYRATNAGAETNQIDNISRKMARKQDGLCTTCGNTVALTGYTKCAKCRNVDDIGHVARREGRAASGLCIYCSAPVHPTVGRKRLSCDACLKIRKGYDSTHASRFSRSRSRAHARGLGWSLTFDEYVALITLPCAYCGLDNDTDQACGLDRLNNDRGYHNNNVVSCCPECNMVRNDIFTPVEMKILGQAVRQIKLARQARQQ